MAITMTLNQIKKEFEEAKDPIKQIDILAQLNQTTQEEIIIALKTAGVDGRKLPRNRKSNDKSNDNSNDTAEPAETPKQKKTPEKRPALVPRDLHECRRMIDLLEGIQSALDHKEDVPPEYVEELDCLFYNFKQRRKKQ